MSRFNKRRVFKNRSDLYQEMAEERDVAYFRQYETARLRYPTAEEMREIRTINHLWTAGDKYYKLAHKYYGDSTLWWVIAWFNKRPTESHIKRGTTIVIPMPAVKVLKYLRNE